MIFLSPCRFQSTFPRGERHLCWLVAVKHIHFNPRSLVGNDSQYQPVLRSLQDFNPRSLVGNDGESSLETQIYIISIHVPSWGTTLAEALFSEYLEISIHVPSWGTTVLPHPISNKRPFQSTFPRGERQPGLCLSHTIFKISIHVPSWGTTISLLSEEKTKKFQSTFPRGERRSGGVLYGL